MHRLFKSKTLFNKLNFQNKYFETNHYNVNNAVSYLLIN